MKYHKGDSDDYGSIAPTVKWYAQVKEDPKKFKPATQELIINLKDEAQKCHNAEVVNYNAKHQKSNKNFQWLKTVMAKGTQTDKTASHIIAIQDNPVSNLETLRNLVGMVKPGKKINSDFIVESLTDLFLEDLLRPGHKLRSFHFRPLTELDNLSSGYAKTRQTLLSYWYFENELKEIYSVFVSSLNNLAHDSVEHNKEKAINAMYKLLSGNPEQEKTLLGNLVNKLGDPSQKVASKAIYCLGELLKEHPNMQTVVLVEMEKLLFRSNISPRTQYYGLCFLSQFVLCEEASDVARKLIEMYFGFFKACVKKGDIQSRMMSALLMGVSRAYPYATLEMEKIGEHIDTLYRIVYNANFNVSLHALTLLFQVADHSNNVADKFYSALYKKLLDPQLCTTTHQAMLLSLLYKSLLKDTNAVRTKAIVKRLLQLTLNLESSFACGVLYLISQLIHKRRDVQSLTLEHCLRNFKEDSDEKYNDALMEINVEDIKVEPEDPDEKTSTDKVETTEGNESIIKVEEDAPNTPGWFHCGMVKKEKPETTDYDPLKRNPANSGAEFTAYVELLDLQKHFHPTVSLYAVNILNGEAIANVNDPLKDFTLMRFLDRFVFKNPKKQEGAQKGAHPMLGRRKVYAPRGTKSLPVTSSNYLQKSNENIPVDEKFLHAFLQRRLANKAEKDDQDSDDVESVDDEDFEEMLDKMGQAKPEDEDLDYAEVFEQNSDNKKKVSKKQKKPSADSDSDENEDEDIDEDESFSEFSDDANDLEDLNDDFDEIQNPSSDSSNKTKKKANKKNDFNSVFASAEEFASILDDEGSSKVRPGSSNVFSNKDRADVKQIAWEDKRNKWLHGYNSAIGKGNRKNFNKSSQSKKRPNQSKGGNMKKKSKK